MGADSEHRRLRVMIANRSSAGLEAVTAVVEGLGHEAVARSVQSHEAATVTADVHPDVALVGVGERSERDLELIAELVRQAACPVIALLETDDLAVVGEAARRGVFASLADATPEQLRDSIEVALPRFAEFQSLEGAFARRAVIERAKGILMERHGADADAAFELLRGHARSSNRKLVDIAAAVVDGHALLPAAPEPRP
jgi:response regulator NasT